MFKALYHMVIARTPTQQAGADIEELERSLYEARLAYKLARQAAEAKNLRITQIRTYIDELKAEYPQDKDGELKTQWLTVNNFASVPESDGEKPADFMSRLTGRRGHATGGFVGKSE